MYGYITLLAITYNGSVFIMTRVSRHTAWKLSLLIGFATQLLLLVFVTIIGLRQLDMATQNLNQVIDVHMRKQSLTKDMVVAARERTIYMLMITQLHDPFERDELFMRFHKQGANFLLARQALLELPLNDTERELMALQARLTAVVAPLQEEVIDLVSADQIEKAATLAIKQAIPGQNDVMAALSSIDDEGQRVALAASSKAYKDHEQASFWMYVFAAAALLIGAAVAMIVFYFTSRISREREQLVSQDALTGLPNRMLFIDRLEQSLIRAKRYETLVGVLFIDLDQFKRVNDTLGHACGDKLICEMAQRLRTMARADDIVARLGGDEFVVVIRDAIATRHILQVAEKMLACIAAPYVIAERELFCSCSIGVSVYPQDGTISADLVKHADTAMYHAKNAGRNCFRSYDAQMNALAGERLQLDTQMHHAMERNEFLFHYQPQLNLKTGRIHGVEALIRWNNPDKGLLGPAVFLEMLNESGNIIKIGQSLLLSACQHTADWHKAGFSDIDVAVNVSSKEFWDDSLIGSVRDALAKSGLPPGSLQLELTEGIFMGDIDAAVKRILALKAIGISVSIDDFGTGYSSLAHLKRFPIDVLKIDRYFVKDLPNDAATTALIGSILSLSKGLSLETIAEGVETKEQLKALRDLGCHIIQGYLVSKPVSPDKLFELLHRNWLDDEGDIKA